MAWVTGLRAAGCAALVCGTLYSPARADVLKDKGLELSGKTYVLAEESDVLSGMTSLRETRKEVDADTRTRKQLEAKVTTAKTFLTTSHKEYRSLEERLAVVHDVNVHNRIVTRMNLLSVKAKEAYETQHDTEEQLAKMGGTAEAAFFDALVPLDDKAEATARKYDALAADPAVKSALAANAKGTLGPTPAFATALRDLKKWRSEIESEAIPLVQRHGVLTVNVLLNGEAHPMVVDTGASAVTLPTDLAAQLKLVPGPDDPAIQLKLADGNLIDGHVMNLKSVRVGRFTVENVTCVVLDRSGSEAPALLGDTFLSHFVVKLDQSAGRLELIEIAGKKPAAAKPQPASEEHKSIESHASGENPAQ